MSPTIAVMEEPQLNAAALKRARLNAGLTQLQLAGEAGVALETVRRIERGMRTLPHPRTLKALADVLGVRVDELLLPTPPPAPGNG